MTRTHTERERPKVGLILPSWTGGLAGATPAWRDTLAVAQAAEAAGFDSLWLADDLLVRFEAGEPLAMWECWSFLAALAASTSRATLGTLVTSVLFRNPALLAKMADTVDEISGGRLILGLGAGGAEGETRAFGFEWGHRFDRLEEALVVVRRLLRERRADFQGRYYSVRECELLPPGPRPHGPPLMVGSVEAGPRMVHLTARFADLSNTFLVFGSSQPDTIPPLRARFDAACAAAGRDPASLGHSVAIGVALPGHRLTFGPWDVTDGALTGPPDRLAGALRAFAAHGVGHVQLYLAPCTVAGVEAIAPALRALERG